jgi:hypothetical protein
LKLIIRVLMALPQSRSGAGSYSVKALEGAQTPLESFFV